MGATALLSNFLCIPNLPQDLMRGFLQLCLALVTSTPQPQPILPILSRLT